VSDDFLDLRVAHRLTRAAQAAQTLSETLWEALHEELTDPRSERVAELSERLGEIAATVASLARADSREREVPVAPIEPEPPLARATDDGPSTEEPGPSTEEPGPSTEEPPPPRGPSATRAPFSAAVLIDELAPTAPALEESAGTSEAPAGVAPQSDTHNPAADLNLRRGDRPRDATPRIEIRDERGEERGPAAWIGSIGYRLERHKQDSSPFAVLLVELVDIERLRRAEPVGEVSLLTSEVEDALARELRPADSLTRESPGRYWLLAPQTDGTGADMLAERLARSVRSSASHRGMPLEVAIGIAVCPDDGRQASALAAHADVGLYAARAAGRSSIR
jgi:GGDEF domain-containing protein